MAKIQKKSKQQFHLIPFFYFPPKDCPSGSHQTIFPQKPQNPQKFLAQGILPQIARIYPPTKTPTDCTDFHRLGGYGIPAIPTQPTNYLPTEFTEHTETTGGEKKSVYICEDCTDVHRLGGKTQPKNLCTSVKSVGGSSPPETSVSICEIRGRISSA